MSRRECTAQMDGHGHACVNSWSSRAAGRLEAEEKNKKEQRRETKRMATRQWQQGDEREEKKRLADHDGNRDYCARRGEN